MILCIASINGKLTFEFLGVTEIKTVPYVPTSHPFVERLIRAIRREYLDHCLFWNAVDLESKLVEFKDYYNRHRTSLRPIRQNTGRAT